MARARPPRLSATFSHTATSATITANVTTRATPLDDTDVTPANVGLRILLDADSQAVRNLANSKIRVTLNGGTDLHLLELPCPPPSLAPINTDGTPAVTCVGSELFVRIGNAARGGGPARLLACHVSSIYGSSQEPSHSKAIRVGRGYAERT